MKKRTDFTIIITAWKEPKTVGRLVKEIESQINFIKDRTFEILLVCPDKQTQLAGKSSDNLGILEWIKDDGIGKPSALNRAFSIAKGDWWIMTDGDVQWGEAVLSELLERCKRNEDLGCLTGHPVPINDRGAIMGYWAHLLTEMAHRERLVRDRSERFLVASGYLMAIKKGLVFELPKNVLSDDALISYIINEKGKRIKYVPDAKVFVKFPTNFSDWIKQKSRSGGGYSQLSQFIKVPDDQMRSFGNEIKGLCGVLTYAQNPKEFYWTVLLLFARLYLWLKIFWERKVTKKSFQKTWTRIESTK